MSKAPDGPFSQVEVIISVQRGRRWSTVEKVCLVERAMRPGMSVSFVARQAGVSPSRLFAWKRRMLEGGHAAVQADQDVVGTSGVRDLERILRRMTMENAALLNRRLRSEGQPTVNAKRVLRIMQHHSLTLERHTARRPGRTHNGVVIALRSNVRGCCDHIEIHARNREVVRIVFVLDACDREIIAYSAVAQVGISGKMVRDLMVTAVERRFGTTEVPQPVEWLSDNGSAYIA